jgi:aspartate 1-decarboxylase
MSNTFEGAVMVVATGVNITTSAASASAVIPSMSSGERPRYIRITASTGAYVRIGNGALTAVNTDMMVQPGDAVIIAVCNLANIAALQVSAPGVVQVSPLENM